MQTADDTAAIEALALEVARLQIEHASRSEAEANRISREAIQSWGDRVPVALAERARSPK